MDEPETCPMCGETVKPGANRCLNCGESLARIAAPASLLKTEVNMSGVLPGAVAGLLFYLVFIVLQFAAGREATPLEPVIGALLCIVGGGLSGSFIAVVARGIRTKSAPKSHD